MSGNESPTIEALYKQLNSSRQGLNDEEALERLRHYGPNVIEEKRQNAFVKFLSYFWGPIPWMIEIAALLSILVNHWDDFAIIMLLLTFNATIGFWEEYKAENALDALKKNLALKARIFRDGKWHSRDAATLVPGDIIKIRLGDIVPADVTLVEGQYISIDQAALTGESLPVSKEVGEIAYSGSIVKKGEMVALVTGTGSNTFFGKTAMLVAGAGAVSHFQQAVMRIGDFLILLALALSALLIAVELHRGDAPIEVVQFVLILIIAAIPVAMPAVLSVTMALGALALSKKKAIVSRLQAIEELAGVDILCSDKTGTLTKNELTLDTPILFGAKSAEACILAAALASKEEDRDPIDLAIINGLKDRTPLEEAKMVAFTPFDPVSKRSESSIKGNIVGKTTKFTKGAPQVILSLCNLSDEEKMRAQSTIKTLASKGYRTLGVASATWGNNWQFLGLLPLYDPPRNDSKATIAEAEKRGLSVKMVTGDNIAIAKEISATLGLKHHIRPASDFFHDGSDMNAVPLNVAQQIEEADGFAEVYPEHKYGIVRALQERGHIVMMTGDGVNDAPALKQADTGIAVSGATDAARAAAALILTAPGLSVIINAVEEARRIFERMLSYIIYRIAMTFDIMFFVVLAMLIFPTVNGVPYQPLTPLMIILLALLDDIPIMTIAYDNTRVAEEPVRWRMGKIFSIATLFGLFAVIQTFGLLILGKIWMREPALQEWLTIDPSHLQTVIFLQLVAGGHLMLFLTRTERFFLRPPFPSWQLFSAILGTQIFAIILCGFGWLVPQIPWTLIGLVWLYNLVWMFLLDFIKLGAYRLLNNRAQHQRRFLKFMRRHLHPHQAAPHNRR